MSKSLGNVIDPLHIINGASKETLIRSLDPGLLPKDELKRSLSETNKQFPNGIPKYGADSLRMALTIYMQQTNQINVDIASIKTANHFCNKLWNTFKFIKERIEQLPEPLDMSGEKLGAAIPKEELSVFDSYILSRLTHTIEEYNKAMTDRKVHKGAEAVRAFIQRDICDRYIELSKLALYSTEDTSNNQTNSLLLRVLVYVFDRSLRALHPYMPFITEELWQKLRDLTTKPDVGNTDISIMTVPVVDGNGIICRDLIAEKETLFELITSFRSFRQRQGLPVSQPLSFTILSTDSLLTEKGGVICKHIRALEFLGKAKKVTVVRCEVSEQQLGSPAEAVASDLVMETVSPRTRIGVSELELKTRLHESKNSTKLPQNSAAIQSRLESKLEKLEEDAKKIRDRQITPEYVLRVPPHAKEADRKKLQKIVIKIEKTLKELEQLKDQLRET
ncbi:hypothetical protein H4219_001682 [Mycoemilia scoparia]|uniref:valine--tRNA ligase n=1 Tax=Mycoemilia scoparia TaxID=417184 RepID=A0A9W8DV21_9FUNG|nr:hypothetical protein H4219_001682 [Mycoemilia scoparia]